MLQAEVEAFTAEQSSTTSWKIKIVSRELFMVLRLSNSQFYASKPALLWNTTCNKLPLLHRLLYKAFWW